MGPAKPAYSRRGVEQLEAFARSLLAQLDATPLRCTSCGITKLPTSALAFTARGLRHHWMPHDEMTEVFIGEHAVVTCGGEVIVDEAPDGIG